MLHVHHYADHSLTDSLISQRAASPVSCLCERTKPRGVCEISARLSQAGAPHDLRSRRTASRAVKLETAGTYAYPGPRVGGATQSQTRLALNLLACRPPSTPGPTLSRAHHHRAISTIASDAPRAVSGLPVNAPSAAAPRHDAGCPVSAATATPPPLRCGGRGLVWQHDAAAGVLVGLEVSVNGDEEEDDDDADD